MCACVRVCVCTWVCVCVCVWCVCCVVCVCVCVCACVCVCHSLYNASAATNLQKETCVHEKRPIKKLTDSRPDTNRQIVLLLPKKLSGSWKDDL